MWYETKRHTTAIRESTSASHYHASLRENIPRCCENPGFIAELSSALVADLPERWSSRNTKSGQMGPTATPCRSSETAFEENIVERCHFCRIHHRAVDFEAYRAIDSERIRHPLYECRSLEITETAFRMELSEAGETRLATGRKSDSGMESKNLAPDKKKPENLGPILRFWMKADSCLFHLFAKRGLRPDARRFCDIVTVTKKYRRSAVLPCRQETKELDFTSVVTRITSLGMKLSVFSGICCAMCENMWFLYGMEDRFISGLMLRPSWLKRTVSMFTDFPAMHPNSILLSTFGRMVSATCRIVHMKLRTVWVRICDARWVGFVVRRVFSNRVSCIRNFHGLELIVSIIS